MAYTAPDYATARADWETAVRAMRTTQQQIADNRAQAQALQSNAASLQDEFSLRAQRVSEVYTEMRRLAP